MIYAPGHPMIAEALKAVTETVLATYNAHTWKAVIPMTGADRVHFYGIATVLKRNGCALTTVACCCIVACLSAVRLRAWQALWARVLRCFGGQTATVTRPCQACSGRAWALVDVSAE